MLGIMCKHSLPSLKRNVTLILKILIYVKVNCGFSSFASLENPLIIQFLKEKGCPMDTLLLYESGKNLRLLLVVAGSLRTPHKREDYHTHDSHRNHHQEYVVPALSGIYLVHPIDHSTNTQT